MELVRPAEITHNHWTPQIWTATGFTEVRKIRDFLAIEPPKSWQRFLELASPGVRKAISRRANSYNTDGRGFYGCAFVDIPEISLDPEEQDPDCGSFRLRDYRGCPLSLGSAEHITPQFGLKGAESFLYAGKILENPWREALRTFLLYHPNKEFMPMLYRRLDVGKPGYIPSPRWSRIS